MPTAVIDNMRVVMSAAVLFIIFKCFWYFSSVASLINILDEPVLPNGVICRGLRCGIIRCIKPSLPMTYNSD